MSKLVRRGFVKLLRPSSPNGKPRGPTKAAGLKTAGPKPGLATCTTPDVGSPTRSGSDETPFAATVFATPALSPGMPPTPPLVTVKGVPVWMRVIPDHCHPPRKECARPGALKNGKSYT